MSFMFKTIDHVQLAAPAGCEEEARRFYHGILGFDEVEKPEKLKQSGGVWFSSVNCHLHIGIEEPFTPAGKAHPAFEVENLDGLKQHLAENGIEYIEDNRIPNVKRFHILDPFGNRIEMVEKY